MVEMMLISSSQREAEMPERRWAKTLMDRTRQGFKVLPSESVHKARHSKQIILGLELYTYFYDIPSLWLDYVMVSERCLFC